MLMNQWTSAVCAMVKMWWRPLIIQPSVRIPLFFWVYKSLWEMNGWPSPKDLLRYEHEISLILQEKNLSISHLPISNWNQPRFRRKRNLARSYGLTVHLFWETRCKNKRVNLWLVVLTILKNISQWEGLSHILWKIRNARNHQPVVDWFVDDANFQ